MQIVECAGECNNQCSSVSVQGQEKIIRNFLFLDVHTNTLTLIHAFLLSSFVHSPNLIKTKKSSLRKLILYND